MKQIFWALAIITCIIPFTVSYGEEWLYYIESPGGDNYYMDVDSIKRVSEDIVRVTEKVVFHDTASRLSMRINELELDCGKKKIRGLQSLNTDQNGKKETANPESGWQDVRPDDMQDSLFEIVCSLKKTEKDYK